LRKGIARKQYKINILASDTGSYGLDIGSSFPELLRSILNEDKRITIEFIQDLNPRWICRYKEDFIDLAKTGRIKSIVAPFQSGNNRVLKLMHRDLNLNEFKETISSMRKHCPGIKLGTQVIVGFPTETEEEFMDTVNFVKECKFDQVDIFAYHEVDGSDSKQVTPKVEPCQILDRAERMRVVVNMLS
jgi:tRNA A37 methylthiotransferase MiaB